MIYIQLSIIALPSYSSMNHFLCFRSILGISKTVNSQILTNIALPLHWDLAHLILNMLIFGGLHYYSESFIFISIWSDFLSNILLWIICNMATKTNLKHAGDDFKQWSKYQTNLSQWYLQWKKCTIQEDMSLACVSLFGFLSYIQKLLLWLYAGVMI